MGQVYYIKDIKKINSSKFGQAEIAGKTIKDAAARNYVAKLVSGGKTAGQIGEKLRKAGLRGDQWGKRLSYLKVIEGEKKSGLTEEQIARNLRRAQRARIDDESRAIGRGATYSKQYAGGREVESHGVMKNIGINREKKGKIGFAQNFNSIKLSGSSASKMSPTGTRPIGL